MHPGLLLLILGLATYRLARLLVKDSFPLVRIPREKIEAWAETDPRFEAVGDLATCSWCASGWAAMVLVVAVDLFSDVSVPLPPVMWAAIWAVAALIAWAEGLLDGLRPDESRTLPAVVHLAQYSQEIHRSATGAQDTTTRLPAVRREE